jgi:hypothetical protein
MQTMTPRRNAGRDSTPLRYGIPPGVTSNRREGLL